MCSQNDWFKKDSAVWKNLRKENDKIYVQHKANEKTWIPGHVSSNLLLKIAHNSKFPTYMYPLPAGLNILKTR